MATMKQVIGLPNSEVVCRIESAPIPEPSDKQVLIKVVVSGSNPKDWKVPLWAAAYNGGDDDSWQSKAKKGINHGDDIAGIVEKVGKDVIAFKVRLQQACSGDDYVKTNSKTERRSRCSLPRDASAWGFVCRICPCV
jgi:NADPH:quinone reductase-like Zn-dependent oxidoreductase